MFEFLFLDLDDTILDFQKAEHIALSKTLEHSGLEPTEAVLQMSMLMAMSVRRRSFPVRCLRVLPRLLPRYALSLPSVRLRFWKSPR